MLGREEETLLGGTDVDAASTEAANDNIDSALYGTGDYGAVMEDGVPWNPPDEPTPEGRDAT